MLLLSHSPVHHYVLKLECKWIFSLSVTQDGTGPEEFWPCGSCHRRVSWFPALRRWPSETLLCSRCWRRSESFLHLQGDTQTTCQQQQNNKEIKPSVNSSCVMSIDFMMEISKGQFSPESLLPDKHPWYFLHSFHDWGYRGEKQKDRAKLTLSSAHIDCFFITRSPTHCPGWLPPAARCSCWGSPTGRRAPLECRAAVWTAGWWCSQRAALQGGCTCEPEQKHQTQPNPGRLLWLWLITVWIMGSACSLYSAGDFRAAFYFLEIITLKSTVCVLSEIHAALSNTAFNLLF